MVPEMGSGHRAGGADLASGVDTAGTVARIDLRLPHHPVCEVASADSDASARITLRLAPTRPLFRQDITEYLLTFRSGSGIQYLPAHYREIL